ncbi:unnamed protein product [Acanthosepion pharaonis]|uniref:Uncharacterized protein n=1 Tax=Acanthosepion pharaonis TaxID=158019 RepID=A0A812DBK9_ACAPH|nr:unnamed protein product [Sepia pharaonis]
MSYAFLSLRRISLSFRSFPSLTYTFSTTTSIEAILFQAFSRASELFHPSVSISLFSLSLSLSLSLSFRSFIFSLCLSLEKNAGLFHVLLNSLSKVLFNFPSRYLSTIGLVPVISLGCSLAPDLGCVPKQPDSRIEGRRLPSVANGPGTRRGRPRSRELRTTRDENERLPSTHAPHVPKPFACDGIRRWASPGSLAVTKGIPVGCFSSA